MTVPAENVRTILNCNGSVTDFAFTFKIFSEGDIKIIATDSNGVETDLTITTDYTVTGENGAFENGGTVSTVKEIDGAMASYAYASGYTITILLDLEFKQETDLEYGGNYSSQALELMSDRLTKIIQQLAAKQIRAFRFKKSSQLSEMELPDPTAGYYLYSPDGISVDWITNVITGSTEATAFGKSLIDDPNASAALTTLGLTTFIKTLMDDVNAYTARKTLLTPLSRVLTTAKTAAYTITSSDDGMLIPVDATAGNIAITFPAVGALWNGFTIGIKKIDSGTNYVESTPDGTEEIDGASSHFLRNQHAAAWYTVDGTGWKVTGRYFYEITNNVCAAALKDPAAGTAGLRTLGTTSVKACAGNDSRLARRTYLFTSNGNFTAQVSHCFVQLIGGGGGGGGGADGEGGGGGGGAGAMVEHQFQMTIGTTYNVVVGAGGPGGAHSGAGGATGGTGSASSITGVSNCSANGGVGGGGAGGGGGIGTGGAGGAIGIMPSSVGGDGSDSPGGRVGGAGGYNMHFSAGGAGGGPDTTPGYAGTGYGGGGGGGGSDAAANGSDGGAGSAGFVLITW